MKHFVLGLLLAALIAFFIGVGIRWVEDKWDHRKEPQAGNIQNHSAESMDTNVFYVPCGQWVFETNGQVRDATGHERDYFKEAYELNRSNVYWSRGDNMFGSYPFDAVTNISKRIHGSETGGRQGKGI